MNKQTITGSVHLTSAHPEEISELQTSMFRHYHDIAGQMKPGQVKIISSDELKNATFEELRIAHPYNGILGKVTVPFNIMVFGGPGQGKSTFIIRLARHLAGNGYRILIVTSEEGISATLKEKFERLNAFHDNIHLTQKLPDNVTGYNLVIIDSVNDVGYGPHEIEKLIDRYNPDNVNFILVFRGTKNGSYREAETFENLVDASLKVDQGNVIVGKNRFGGSGTMNVFNYNTE